jgi:hypothetical protein
LTAPNEQGIDAVLLVGVAVLRADIDVVAQVLELRVVAEASVVGLLIRDRQHWVHTVLLSD